MSETKYLVAHLPDGDYNDGHHMTALYCFVTNRPREEVQAAIRQALLPVPILRTVVVGADCFESDGEDPVQVQLLERTNEMEAAHLLLKWGVQRLGATFYPKWNGLNWNPHVSEKEDLRPLEPDQVIEIRDMDLLVYKGTDDWESVDCIPLQSDNAMTV